MIDNIGQTRTIPDIGDMLNLNNAKGIACIGIHIYTSYTYTYVYNMHKYKRIYIREFLCSYRGSK
jgi:uncharacterized LabA/DUF88 family protein